MKKSHLVMARTSYRPEIDGLRAIAILTVVFFHAFPHAFPGGFIGVDVFFVISGFLITGIIEPRILKREFHFFHFYARRIQRLLPALLVVLLSVLVAGWFILLPDEFLNLGKHLVATAGFGENLLLWKESGYFDREASLKPFLHFWSLGIEEQFYLFWPTLLALFSRLRKKTRIILIIFLGICSLYLSVSQVHFDPEGTFYGLSSRLWELIAGSLVYFYYPEVKMRPPPIWFVRSWMLIVSLLFSGACLYLDSSLILYPGFWPLIPVSFACTIILFGEISMSTKKFLGSWFFVQIGLISYPLYLWHWPILSFLKIVEGNLLSQRLIIEGVIFSFLLAILTFQLIEKPLRRFISKIEMRHSSKQVCLSGIFVLLIFALLGTGVWQLKGMPDRFRDAVFTPFEKPEDILKETNRFHRCEKWPSEFEKDVCREFDPGKSRTMVWGDSHAPALALGLEALGSSPLLISQGACAPLIGIEFFNGPQAKDNCQIPNRKILDYLSVRPEIKNVVLVSMGTPYIRQIRNNKKIFLRLIDQEQKNDTSDAFRLGYERTIRALIELKKNIVIYVDHPEFANGLDPNECDLPRPVRFSSLAKPACEQPKRAFELSHQIEYVFYRNLKSKFPQISLVWGADEICDQETCYAISRNTKMYIDQDHLSRAAGIRVAHAIQHHLK